MYSGGLGLAKALSSLFVDEGGVYIAESSEDFPGCGTHWNTRRVCMYVCMYTKSKCYGKSGWGKPHPQQIVNEAYIEL